MTPDVTLIGAHVNSDDSSFNIGMVAFADALKDVSGGKMVMEVHGNGELGGDETELVQKMATGTIDVVATSPSFLASVQRWICSPCHSYIRILIIGKQLPLEK